VDDTSTAMNDAIIQDDLDDFVILDNTSNEVKTTRPMMTDVVQASVPNELNTMKLYQALPESTQAERYRFLIDRDGDTNLAIIKLGNYLDWRRKHSYDDVSSCHFDSSWTYATQLALRDDATTKNSNTELKLSNVDKLTRTVDTSIKLPCTLFTFEHEQKKYLLHLPARINTQLASTSVYALALAIYIDHTLDRSSMEKIILVIDVRAGQGWANINAINLIPFIQETVRLLCDLHPTRLEQCIIYPVPVIANIIWKAVKPFVGKDTVKKICLVSGSGAGMNDIVPEKVNKYLDSELLKQFETTRMDCFSKQ
jgi:hypothetical protein